MVYIIRITRLSAFHGYMTCSAFCFFLFLCLRTLPCHHLVEDASFTIDSKRVNESLATSVVPTSFKKSVIIPVPKNSKPSCLNDYHPVALISIVMEVFERLLKNHICSSIPATLDPLQFAYRPNRSTDDAIFQVLHSSLTHIDSNNGNYVRMLFIDYSSAFNTAPHQASC